MEKLSTELAVVLDAFREHLLAEDTSQHTITAYLSDVRLFVAWYIRTYQDFVLADVTPTDIRRYREELQEQSPIVSAATINRRLASLRRFFVWTKEQYALSHVPTERIRNVESQAHGPKSLDRKQWHRLLRAVEQAKGPQGVRDRCVMLVLYHTGLRAGELAAVRLGDVTLGERSGQLVVRRGKGNKTRSVPLNADARAAIREYVSVRPETQEQRLLLGQRKEPLSAHAIYDLVAKYGNQAGLEEVTPHMLRHTFACTLVSQGVPLSDVADLLGHSSLDTTRIYTRASENDLQAIVARLEVI